MRRFLLIFLFVLALIPVDADAQTIYRERSKCGGPSVSTMDRSVNRGTRGDDIILYGKYSDKEFQKIKEQMDQREWGDEESAWAKVCDIGTKEAFEQFVARFPNGRHRPEAAKKIVDLSVNDMFKAKHNDFPQMRRVVADDESPTSTVVVENMTRYPMSVYYSGPDSRSVEIMPGRKATVTLRNGNYRVGASVPVPAVRPFAGDQYLMGGRFEVGFVISSQP